MFLANSMYVRFSNIAVYASTIPMNFAVKIYLKVLFYLGYVSLDKYVQYLL